MVLPKKCFQRAISRISALHHLILGATENLSLEEPQILSIGCFSPLSRLKPKGRLRGLDKGEKQPYP
jgi:hypothetical protein